MSNSTTSTTTTITFEEKEEDSGLLKWHGNRGGPGATNDI